MRNRARQTRALLPCGTSCRSKNPPLTHGDPAEAGPPGQSQPSRVHPVKQRAGAMRTRTGTLPPSTARASLVPYICAYLSAGSGGGRHPQTHPTSPSPCGIAQEKPPKWRTATPGHIPPLPPPACLLSCPPGRQTPNAHAPDGRAPGSFPSMSPTSAVSATHKWLGGPGWLSCTPGHHPVRFPPNPCSKGSPLRPTPSEVTGRHSARCPCPFV